MPKTTPHPLDQYLTVRNADIVLARSSAGRNNVMLLGDDHLMALDNEFLAGRPVQNAAYLALTPFWLTVYSSEVLNAQRFRPDAMIVLVGHRLIDVYLANNTDAEWTDRSADLDGLMDYCKARTPRLAFCTIPPFGAGFTTTPAVTNAAASGVLLNNGSTGINDLIRTKCAAKGILLVDLWASLLQPGTTVAQDGVTIDGFNLSRRGKQLVASACAGALITLFNQKPDA